MDTVYAFILGLLPTIITSLVIFYLQRKQRRTDAIQEAHAAASRKESLLMLELQMATAKLAYAVASASVLAGVLSILTSISTGLPECPECEAAKAAAEAEAKAAAAAEEEEF